MRRNNIFHMLEDPNSHFNLGFTETYSYEGKGVFILTTTYDPLRGMIQGVVNDAGTHMLAGCKIYKIKDFQLGIVAPGQKHYFLPAVRKYKGELWARNVAPVDCKKETSSKRLEPQPIGGGLLIGKSTTENVGYTRGPQGGVSAGRRTNNWERVVMVLWHDGTLEMFVQRWSVNTKADHCIRGRGMVTTESRMLEHLKSGKMVPFKTDLKRAYLPTGG